MAAKPVTVLGAAPVGSVVRLRAPIVLGGTLILSAGDLLLVTNQDNAAATLVRWNDGGEFIGPTFAPKHTPVELVSSLADRRGVVADGQPVQDPQGGGR